MTDKNTMLLLESALLMIQRRLACYTQNTLGKSLDLFSNTGEEFRNDTFHAKAYDWKEEGNSMAERYK